MPEQWEADTLTTEYCARLSVGKTCWRSCAERVKAILLTPRTEWPVIEQEPDTPPDLFIRYVAILAAIPAISRFVGQSLIGDYAPILPSLLRMVIVYRR